MFSRRLLLDKVKLLAMRAAAVGTDGRNSAGRLQIAFAQSSIAAPAQAANHLPDINVVDFGADPTGTRDSSGAIIQAIVQCFAGPDPSRPASLYFPSGIFLISRDDVFRPPPLKAPVLSWRIQGNGRRTTTLRFRPIRKDESRDYFLYAGAAADNAQRTILGLILADVLVKLDTSLLDSSSQVHCFRQNGIHQSPGPEQDWTFSECIFEGDFEHPERNGAILRIEGDANGSENAFVLCRALAFKHVIECLNPQAVNHLSLHCHWEVMFGDMFRFIRGGNVAVYGGSLIVDNLDLAEEWRARTSYASGSSVYYDGRKFRTESGGMSGTIPISSASSAHFDGSLNWRLEADESRYILRVGGDLTGQINSFLISGARIELRSNRAKLVAGGDLNARSLVVFDAVAVQPVVGGFRHTIEIAESELSIRFQNCRVARAAGIWDEPIAVAFGPGPDADYPNRATGGAQIVLDGCQVSEGIHTLSSWGAASVGTFTVRDCQIAYREDSAAKRQSITTMIEGTVAAVPGLLRRSGLRRSKDLFVPFSHWPRKSPGDEGSNDDILVTLPPQTIVKRLVFAKRGQSKAAAKYGLRLVDLAGGATIVSTEMVDFDKPFELIMQLLSFYSAAAPLQLAIRGLGELADEVPASPNDFILLEWS